jgi:hypothetical protein
MMFNPGKAIQHEHEVIMIDDNMDDGQEPMDPEDRIVCVSSKNPPDNPPVPEDILAVAQELGDTEDQAPERLWKEWTENQETQREETFLMQDQHSSKATKTKIEELEAKAKIPEDNEEPVPKRPRFIEKSITTIVPSVGDRRQVFEEEDPVEMVCITLPQREGRLIGLPRTNDVILSSPDFHRKRRSQEITRKPSWSKNCHYNFYKNIVCLNLLYRITCIHRWCLHCWGSLAMLCHQHSLGLKLCSFVVVLQALELCYT